MIVFFHVLMTTSMVWMVVHFWWKLPLEAEETDTVRNRKILRWVICGAGVPLSVWFFMNLGLTRWLPPFLSEVDVAKNAGGFWPLAILGVTSPAMTLIATWWAAVSLVGIVLKIREQTENRTRFLDTTIWGTLLLSPFCLIILWLGGLKGIGPAVVIWLAPIVHVTLSKMVEPKTAPSYSQAIAKLKFGKYSEAEMDIIRELEGCQNDFKGWMMLAELYAVHFHDFDQAEQTVIDLCEQPSTDASNASVALHRLADWYLELRNDPEGAHRCMQAIATRYPRTHLARMARVRSQQLPRNAEQLIESRKMKPLHLPALHDGLENPNPVVATDPAELSAQAERLSEKLSADPADVEAREEFARALAGLDKVQPAIDQVDLLLELADQPEKARAEWMGLKASWLMQFSGDSPELRLILEKIIREFPGSPQAMGAQRRVLLLDEQVRVKKYAKPKEEERRRIVIRMDEPGRHRDGT